jgi:hypothetical protein
MYPTISIVAVALALALLSGTLVWSWLHGQFSALGAAGGLLVGVLVSTAWALRDSLLQGEPRPELARRVSLSLAAAGLALVVALWGRGPESGATAIVMASAVFCAELLFILGMTARVNREVESPLVTVRGGSVGRALVVYHSTRGGLMRGLQEALATGLQAQGWQADVSTASRVTPTDLSGYQLLVLGAPCYNREPARPILAYLNRLGDLRGIPVVIVVTGFNRTDRAMQILRDRVRQAHGQVLDEVELWTARRNVVREGTSDPTGIMRRIGGRVARRVRAAAA